MFNFFKFPFTKKLVGGLQLYHHIISEKFPLQQNTNTINIKIHAYKFFTHPKTIFFFNVLKNDVTFKSIRALQTGPVSDHVNYSINNGSRYFIPVVCRAMNKTGLAYETRTSNLNVTLKYIWKTYILYISIEKADIYFSRRLCGIHVFIHRSVDL